LFTTEVTAGRARVVGDVGCALVVAASELHVVLGAAGGTGSAVVRELGTPILSQELTNQDRS
jgi:hypothetical protein